jgi:hypothetical protein
LAWLGLAWLGLAWLGLAWLGLAWLGLAWAARFWFGAIVTAYSKEKCLSMRKISNSEFKITTDHHGQFSG